ncbi:hypothetical protein GTY54_25385 [Streptomyces sp. SID625]|nr:hypothetical protein [Streptomyces sp. SID625]
MDNTWTCGWAAARISTVGDGRAVLAVVGECGADQAHLRDALPVVRAKGWRAPTCWPGSYLAVARSGGTLAVIGDLARQAPGVLPHRRGRYVVVDGRVRARRAGRRPR